MQYTILIEKPQAAGDGFGAYCPDVPGCVVAGASEEGVILMMKEALALHLEDLGATGQPLPQPTVKAFTVEVAVAADA